jgi:hypothetical protein
MPEKVNGDKPTFRWTAARIEKLREMKLRGWGDLRIAVNLGNSCTEGGVRYAWECLQKFGRVRKGPVGKPYTKKEDEFIARKYCQEGWLAVDIASALGRDGGSLRARICRLKLTREETDEIKQLLYERRCSRHKQADRQSTSYSMKDIWTVRTESKRAKLYNGMRYEDANVPIHAPRCGRLG